MLKVLYATGNLGPGGKERQFIETVTGIDRTQVLPIVVVFKAGAFYSDKVSSQNIPFYQLPRGKLKISPFFNSWKVIRKNKPDIIHSWDTLSMIYTYLPARFFGARIVDGSIRDSGVDKGFWFYIKKLFLMGADTVIANSQAGLNAYNVKGEVIFNGINPERFPFKIVTDKFNMIMVANFSDYKDHLTFLKASVDLVQNKIVDDVYLIGDGPNKAKYVEWIENGYPEIKNNFHFTGVVGNVEDYLACCNIGVLCSTTRYGEGLSNSVLEYMASGTIPIVTDIGGSNEIIENGVNGYLIEPENFNVIIALVKQIKCNILLQEKLITNAKITIDQKFSLIKNLRLLTSLYSSFFN